MNIIKIIGIVLILAGAAALAYGQFTYTRETHEADLGPLQLQVKEEETVDIPKWAGLGAIGLGLVMLVVPFRR